MSDQQKPTPKAIPAWQRDLPPDSATNAEEVPTKDPNSPEDRDPGSRAILIEQASQFLEDPKTKHATMERKMQFLESKGLTNHEIFEMLGIARKDDVPVKAEPEGETGKSNSQEVPAQQIKPSAAEPQDPAPTASHMEAPPIITYPEFLMHSQKPPPLITAQRLLNAFYIATGIAATIYGTDQFIVSPMLDSLATARHSLFDTAATNLDTLNGKLEHIVSIVPGPSSPVGDESSTLQDEDDEEVTQFFHRSIATQTSPDISRISSSSSSPAPQMTPSPTDIQNTQLQKLHSQLSSLVPSTGQDNTLESRLTDLQTYLGGMAYGGNLQFGKVGGEEKDEISKVKAEIRGVKGVLLSARNFPSGIATRS